MVFIVITLVFHYYFLLNTIIPNFFGAKKFLMKKINGLMVFLSLGHFTLFSEYFISTTIIYVLVVSLLITYSAYGLILQKAISECVFLILIMACYLVLNDDLLTLNFVGFNNFIINDYLSYITKILICFFSAIYFLIISNVLKEQKLTSFEYLLVILFAILGLLLMCSSNDFLIIYLSIELSSLSLYILASFKKNSSYSIESGLKYFVTGALSFAFFLLGSSFIYLHFGSIYFDGFFFLEKIKEFYNGLNLINVVDDFTAFKNRVIPTRREYIAKKLPKLYDAYRLFLELELNARKKVIHEMFPDSFFAVLILEFESNSKDAVVNELLHEPKFAEIHDCYKKSYVSQLTQKEMPICSCLYGQNFEDLQMALRVQLEIELDKPAYQ